jgi:hypothetical protein
MHDRFDATSIDTISRMFCDLLRHNLEEQLPGTNPVPQQQMARIHFHRAERLPLRGYVNFTNTFSSHERGQKESETMFAPRQRQTIEDGSKSSHQ